MFDEDQEDQEDQPQDHVNRTYFEGADQEDGSPRLPKRFDAGDGEGEYVYRRRGLFGRTRALMSSARAVWLEHGVPADEEDPPFAPDSLRGRLTATPKRKLLTGLVCVTAAVLMMTAVLLRVS